VVGCTDTEGNGPWSLNGEHCSGRHPPRGLCAAPPSEKRSTLFNNTGLTLTIGQCRAFVRRWLACYHEPDRWAAVSAQEAQRRENRRRPESRFQPGV